MTKHKWWETTLIIIGSPVWLSLLISLAAAAVSVYVSLWAIVISLWAVFVSFIAFGLYGIASGVAFACAGNISGGVALTGCGIACAGLSVFTSYGCKFATKWVARLGKACFCGIKKIFCKKEAE